MRPITYAAAISEPEPGEFLVTFADVPEALTGAATRAEAEALAADALAVALEGYLEAGRPLPPARSAGRGEVDVALDPAIAARAVLIAAMAAQKLSKVALGERLGRDEKAVRRILAGEASFKQLLQALQAVGVRPALAA